MVVFSVTAKLRVPNVLVLLVKVRLLLSCNSPLVPTITTRPLVRSVTDAVFAFIPPWASIRLSAVVTPVI